MSELRFPENERFRQQRPLGTGAFGAVFEVEDRDKGVVVALKVLQRAQPDALFRFKSEFRSVLELRHPNLVQLYELFGEGENWYFTMELVDGISPLTWLGTGGEQGATMETMDGPLSTLASADMNAAYGAFEQGSTASEEGQIRSVFLQLARGLAALHEVGLVHRDLKPDNVLVDANGGVKLLDFGLAELVQDETSGLAAAGRAGTPGYIAPEVRGRAEVTAAADWYAFGVMLYQALGGGLPRPGAILSLPGTELADLADLSTRLLQMDPAVRPDGAEVLELLGDERRAARGNVELVGRAEELTQLVETFESRRHAGPAVVLLTGESGVGKSALAQHFVRSLRERHGAMVLAGRCYQQMSVPLRALDALVDALARQLRQLGPASVESVRPSHPGELAQLFPVLGLLAAEDEGELPQDAFELRRRAFASLGQLLGALTADRPVVLVLDDLQWGDQASAQALAQLLMARQAPRVLLLGTCRSKEAGESPFLQAWEELRERPWVQTLQVPPLSEAESALLAHKLLDEQADVDGIIEEAGGNPMFVELLARWTQRAGPQAPPPSLELALQGRLDELSDRERALLDVVAVAGQPMSQKLLLTAAEAGPHEELDALRLGRFIRTREIDGEAVAESYHDRIRETAVAMMGSGRVKAINRGLAEVLVEARVDDPGQIALRYQAAEDVRAAKPFAVQAADRAFDGRLYDRAVPFYELARTVADDDDRERLTTRNAESLIQVGRAADAAPLCEAVAELRGGDPEWQRIAAEQWSTCGYRAQAEDTIRELLLRGGFRWPRAGLPLMLGLVWGLIRLRWADRRIWDGQDKPLSPEMQAKITLCWSACRALVSADQLRGMYYLLQGLLLSLRAGHQHGIGRFGLLFYPHLAFRGSAWGIDRFEACRQIAHQTGDGYLLSASLTQQGYIHHCAGDMVEALDFYGRGLRQLEAECHNVGWEGSAVRGGTLDALEWRGELDAFADFQDEAHARAARLSDRVSRRLHDMHHAFLDIAQGRAAAKRAQLERDFPDDGDQAFIGEQFIAGLFILRAALHEGRLTEVWDRLDPLLARMRAEGLHQLPAYLTLGLDLEAAMRISALRDPSMPSSRRSMRQLERAIKHFDNTPPQKHLAGLGAQHGAALALHQGRSDEARAKLTEALRIFELQGLLLRAACCRGALAQLDGASEERVGEALRGLGVADPVRYLQAYCPGFDG